MAVSELVVSAHRNLLVVVSELVVLVSFQSPDCYTSNPYGICLCKAQAGSQDFPGGGSFFLDTILWAWHLVN